MYGDLNSQSRIILDLTTLVVVEAYSDCSVPLQNADRDCKTIRNRLRNEGISFVTKTLPVLGGAIDKALQTGTFQSPSAFKLKKGKRLPCFLYGLLERIFDTCGVLRDDACVRAITHVRQIVYAFYKYKLPYSDSTLGKFYEDFLRTDEVCFQKCSNVEQMSTIFYAKEVVNEVLQNFTTDHLRPRNGPGSVAEGEKPWERFKPKRFYPELDELIPYQDFFFYNERHLFDAWETYWCTEVRCRSTAKLMAVAKDSRGPRLISSEPQEKMSYQQALRLLLYTYFEHHPITKGHINFTDQSINGALALDSSVSKRYATLDLSKASDFLSKELVSELLSETSIHDYVMKSRSSEMLMPDGSTHELRKFAPMGNALTFPIQALTFFSISVGAIMARGRSLTYAASQVFVYGDDIIVPMEYVNDIIESLENVGLRINRDKSCLQGHFRESCGVDAYKGVNITPLKFKKVYTGANDVTELTAWVAYGNDLFFRGYWRVADYIRSLIEKVHGSLPCVSSNSPILGWITWSKAHVYQANEHRLRHSKDYQCKALKGIQPYSRPTRRLSNGWECLLRHAWYKPLMNDEPFSAGNFTARHAVTKKHVVVGIHHV